MLLSPFKYGEPIRFYWIIRNALLLNIPSKNLNYAFLKLIIEPRTLRSTAAHAIIRSMFNQGYSNRPDLLSKCTIIISPANCCSSAGHGLISDREELSLTPSRWPGAVGGTTPPRTLCDPLRRAGFLIDVLLHR